jgi:hypothetical protein
MKEDPRNIAVEVLAAHYKWLGMDNREAFNQLIKDRALQPGIDMKPFTKIFESVNAKPIVENRSLDNFVGEAPTHRIHYRLNNHFLDVILISRNESLVSWYCPSMGCQGSDPMIHIFNIEKLELPY